MSQDEFGTWKKQTVFPPALNLWFHQRENIDEQIANRELVKVVKDEETGNYRCSFNYCYYSKDAEETYHHGRIYLEMFSEDADNVNSADVVHDPKESFGSDFLNWFDELSAY